MKYWISPVSNRLAKAVAAPRSGCPDEGNLKASRDTVAVTNYPGFELPRYWEGYDLEKKTIWDQSRVPFPLDPNQWFISPDRFSSGEVQPEAFQKAGWTGEWKYQDYPPTEQLRAEVLLKGDKVAMIDRNLDSANIAFLNLTTEEAWRRSALEDVSPITWRSLQGGRVWYAENREGKIESIASEDGKYWERERIDNAVVTRNKYYVLVKSEITHNFFLYDSNGNEKVISQLISPHADRIELLEANGEYFVLEDPATGGIFYLDPRMAMQEAAAQKPQQSEADRQRAELAIKLWQETMWPHRAGLIAQARSAYRPILALIPEEFRNEIEKNVGYRIKILYSLTEGEILNLFQAYLEKARSPESKKEPDVEGGLHVHRFAQKLNRMEPLLKEFLDAVKKP